MEESFLAEGLQNIKRTQEALSNLETKMVQYLSKSKDNLAAKRPPPSPMPLIGFDFPSRQESRHESKQLSRPASSPRIHENAVRSAEKEVVDVDLEGEFEYYRRKLLNAEHTSHSMSKIEEFYQKRTEMLEQRANELQQRRRKVKREKDLLAKENRRIQNEIDGCHTSEKHRAKEAHALAKTLAEKGRLAKEQKVKELRALIQKEKSTEESLRTQLQSYESSLKLLLELQKNLVTVDLGSKELRKTLNRTAKSRSTVLKPAANRHRQCCAATIQKSKSRSMVAK